MDLIDFQNGITQANETTMNQFQTNIVNAREDYSTNEMRVGTWIDGSAIYRKVISCNLGTLASNWTNLADAPTGLNRLIKLQAIDSQFNLPIYINSTYWCNFRCNSGKIDVQGGSGFDNHNIYLIIDYTKTS